MATGTTIMPGRKWRTEAERVRAANRIRRAGERDVELPDGPKDPVRREACKADVFQALRTYFPRLFYNPFTAVQREMVLAILHTIKHGGLQSIADSRGGGKTTITSCVATLAILFGWVPFAVVVCATDPKSRELLRNIKHQLQTNAILAEDFRECALFRYLAGSPQRATTATVNGQPTYMVWRDNLIIFPVIDGCESSGAIIRTVGIGSGEIRGLIIHGRRPDLIILDDLDTAKSANSIEQTKDREKTIERDLLGLAGPDKALAAVMLCTVQNRTSLAWSYTDPKIKPSWHGKRFKYLEQEPTNHELWQEYVHLRLAGMEDGSDPDGRKAHAFYLEKREAMDAGAVVSNPHRFIAAVLPDKSQTEVSALQHFYNLVADHSKGDKDGWAHVLSEYQNDPPEDELVDETGLTARLVESRLSGFKHRELPEGLVSLTAFIDVGKYYCHWVVAGWWRQAIGFVVDYGVLDVHNTAKGDKTPATIDRAILQALRQWKEDQEKNPYLLPSGEAQSFDVVLVDSGDFTDAVYCFTREAGTPYRPSKGFGQGLRSPSFHPGTAGPGRRVGNHWYTQLLPERGITLVALDADHWKKFVHARFSTVTLDQNYQHRPGTLSLFSPGDDRHRHKAFSHHIVAEVWREVFTERGLRRGFHRRSPNNHWLDATAGACAAADMCGIRVVEAMKPKRVYVSLEQLGSRNRR